MNDRISAIRERCEAATPGPWKVVEGKSFGVQSENKNIAACFRTENEQFIAHSREDLPWALDQIAEREKEIARLHDLLAERNVLLDKQDAEIVRMTEALEIEKRGHVNCMSAERQSDGKCLGYGRGENDDEPCAQCATCPQCTAYEPEMKTIQEWAKLDGIFVYDPDGFDRSDPLLWEKEITKAEYLAGIAFCTVLPLPAAPKGE